MPLRSLTSSVLRWPDGELVVRGARHWARSLGQRRRDVVRVGYFGAYARSDWGVGSDLDVIVVVETAAQPFERRGVEWDTTDLPVPIDLLVYTEAEWQSLERQGRPARAPWREAVWVYVR
ncbi:MAG: nucleotidyltransferase domain-containing protein [Planctomycetes bacterium]|nr:nucleotidyltransferase domain-containing protein [Planctomycetota bacterium]